jgi:hypothetical protein
MCPHDISPGLFLWIAIQASLPAATMIPSLRGALRRSDPFFVIAGLDPAIHPLRKTSSEV